MGGGRKRKSLPSKFYRFTEHFYVRSDGCLSPTLLNRAFGMTWSVGGWLLMRFLGKLDPAKIGELYKRVADEINTTFAIESTQELSFEEAMTPEVIEKYNAKTTGGKYILNPNKG